MTIRLTIVCHAATEATRAARLPDDEPLDDRGAVAAREAAIHRVDDAFRGPERRCAETATALGLQATAVQNLADLDLGSWSGRTLTELETDHPADLAAWLTDPAATPHGGESLSALMDRVGAWLTDLTTGPTHVAAVTHPAVVRATVLHALGAPVTCFWRLDVPPLSQTRLTHHGGRWQLRETGHPLG